MKSKIVPLRLALARARAGEKETLSGEIQPQPSVPSPVAMKLSLHPTHLVPLLAAFGLIKILLTGVLHAEDVGWHSDLTGELGRGYSHRNPLDLRKIVAVFDSTTPELINQTGKKWDVTFTQHQFDVSRLLDLNVGVSARNLTLNGKVGFSFVDSTQFSENSLTFAVAFNNDFGRRVYHATGLSQEFQSFVAVAKQTLRGEALHKAITDEFGTHFISGHKLEAKLVVLYRFDFGSLSKVRELSANTSGNYTSGVNSANWQARFRDLLTQQESSLGLSYRLTTSATTTEGLPSLPEQGTITSVAQFLEFANKLQAYGEAMKEQHAMPTRYIIEPIQNLPGYAALVDNFSPSTQFDNSYERFMETYAKFKAWEDRLLQWSGDARHMSWLNAEGQKIVTGMRAEVTTHLKQLQAIARNHFQTGAPLTLTQEIINYQANFSRVPIPRIGQSRLTEFRPIPTAHWVLWIGGVEAGPIGLTIDRPFNTVALLSHGAETGVSYDVFFNESDFVAFGKQGAGFKGNSDVAGLFNDFSASPAWQALRTAAAQRRIGFVACFISRSDPWDPSRLSLAVKDATGQFVDVVPWLATANFP